MMKLISEFTILPMREIIASNSLWVREMLEIWLIHFLQFGLQFIEQFGSRLSLGDR